MPLKDVVDLSQSDGSDTVDPVQRIYVSPLRNAVEMPTTSIEEVLKPVDEPTKSVAARITDRLFGLNGVERYQTWPERVVREAVTAPHDIIQPNPYDENKDSELHSWYEDQRDKGMLKAAMAVSALAGTGGLAGTGEAAAAKGALTSQDIALGAGPMLRPALKFNDKIYKAPPNGQHLDALPPEMYNEFQKSAMAGDDISKYNFGFMNHKGQFLSREAALDYAIKEGLLNPNSEAARAGTLTSTMELQ